LYKIPDKILLDRKSEGIASLTLHYNFHSFT